jgi:poly(3-hydroxybutyrate) depolymerase
MRALPNHLPPLLVTAVALSASATAQTPAVDTDRIAGWYEVEPAHLVLVSPGPRGGYRLLDFDRPAFHELARRAEGEYRVQGDGAWQDRVLRVERAQDGAAAALRCAIEGREPRLPRAIAPPFEVEEARFRSGEIELAGPLLVPREPARGRPAVVVLHGSGDSDRDNVWAFTFAQHAARAGLVTLFPDKRGCGASGGDWKTAGLAGLADDALAAVAHLRADPRVDAERIGLLGLSQGGVVAALAARRAPSLAFLAAVSSAPLPLFEQMRHELTQDLARAGMPEEGVAEVLAVAERAVGYARSGADADWEAYADARHALASGRFRAAAAGLPAERADWQWRWWRDVGDADPLPAWEAFAGLRLAIFGALDETDNVPVRRSVELLERALARKRSSRDAVRVYEARGHTLVDPERGWVDAEVLAFLATWMRSAVE